jgi:hypothetical protein
MQDGIQVLWCDLRGLGMPSSFQNSGSGLAHPRDLVVGKPLADQADDLMRPYSDRRVPQAQSFADVRHRRQQAHKVKDAPGVCLVIAVSAQGCRNGTAFSGKLCSASHNYPFQQDLEPYAVVERRPERLEWHREGAGTFS